MPTYNQTQILTFYTVKGMDGVNAFPVKPGDRALLIDSEDAIIYVKAANALGQILPLEIYDLVYRKPVQEEPKAPKISYDEIDKEVDKRVKEALRKYFPQITFED